MHRPLIIGEKLTPFAFLMVIAMHRCYSKCIVSQSWFVTLYLLQGKHLITQGIGG